MMAVIFNTFFRHILMTNEGKISNHKEYNSYSFDLNLEATFTLFVIFLLNCLIPKT